MTRRVFLHVGAPKTGTSYLQATLAENRELLREHGLDYPATTSGSHFEAAIDVTDHRWGGVLDTARGSWESLVRSAAPGADVVISHEVLAAATKQQADRAIASFPGAEIHLIYTARDLVRQLPAEWQETVKHRGRQKLADFLEQVENAARVDSDEWFWRVQSLPDVLRRWGSTLPPERVHVITVPPSGTAPDVLWSRFAGVLGVGDVAVRPAERRNESLGIAETQLVRRLNIALRGRAIAQPVYAEWVRDLLAHDTLAGHDGAIRATPPPAVKPFVDEVTAEWLAALDERAIDVVGSRDELIGRWPSGEWVDPDSGRPREVGRLAIEALAEMITAQSEAHKTQQAAGGPPVQWFRRLRRGVRT